MLTILGASSREWQARSDVAPRASGASRRHILSAVSSRPAWTQRFTHPTIEEVSWASGAPDHLAAVTTEDGSTQAWAWDVRTGERRRVSKGGVGAEEAHVLPDGSGVVWWYDEIGNERGRWMVTPFEGGDPRPLFRGFHDEWMMGLSLVQGAIAAGFATDEDYRAFVAVGDEAPREIYRHREPAGVGREWPQGGGGLSPDGALVCIHHSENGDIDRQALRVLDSRSGETRGRPDRPGAPDGGGRLVAGARGPATPLHPGAHRDRAAGDLGPRHAGSRRHRSRRRDGSGDPAGMDARGRAHPRAQRPRARGESTPLGRSGVGVVRGSRETRGHDPRSGVPSGRRALVPGGFERRASFRPGRRRRHGASAPARPPTSGHPEPLAHVEQSGGRSDPRLHHDASRIRAVPDDRIDPRRPRMAPHRSVGSRAPGVRGRGVRGPPGQLPRLHRPREGLPRGAEGQHRLPGDRGHRGGRRPRRGRGTRRPARRSSSKAGRGAGT